MGIFQTDAVGQCFYVNKRWCEITGLMAEQAVEEGWVNAIHPDDRTNVFANWMKAINESQEFVMEFRFVSAGEIRWVKSHAIQITGAGGDIEGYIGTINDITELKTVQQRLSEREQLYRLISTNSRDIITLFTADKVPVRRFISPSVREILGYKPEELINRAAFDIVHPDDVDLAKDVMSLLIATRQPASLEYRAKRRDGQYVWLESKLNPIIDSDDRITGILTAVRDITQRKAFEESLHLAKVHAEEATMAKSHFLSMMSHEIRTPMNAILGLTQLLIGSEPRPDQKDNLELLRFSGENLLTIINDILDFSKIEAGKIELEQTDFDVHNMLRSTVQMFEHKAWQKGIKLELSITDGVPKHVLGDPVRISQVVNNLVGNAIKFTNQGQVTVRVSGSPHDKQRHAVTFEVIDTGIGIPDEKLKTIFDRFSQADSNTTRKFGGTGLGLSISKSLAELMGGSITVDSNYGVGSTFSFSVDLQKADQGDSNCITATQTLQDFRIATCVYYWSKTIRSIRSSREASSATGACTSTSPKTVAKPSLELSRNATTLC
ncbi:MAG: PAS domain S-box protein [Bacteroidia bacterium]|nr:PAS domain S-box protein [Bacteroidia bacterium]